MLERISKIAGRARYTTLDEVGRVTVSDYSRHTEEDAALLTRWGIPIPASDTIRELRDKGYKRCPRCGHYKPPESYGTYKRSGYERLYQKTYCHHCLADMERTRRFSKVEVKSPYPMRLA